MSVFTRASVGAGAFTLPGHYYTSEEIFRVEQERIFARSWVLVGRAEQIADAGAYFLAEVAGESLIVVRGKDGAARALFNVCRHRGTRLCTEAQGRFASTIQCPYHAWTYGLDGELLAARHMQEVPTFDKADWPLRQAALAEWEGFLFVNLADEPEPFERAYAPLIGKFAAWGLPELRVARRIDYDLACNWKLIVQNYSECYHCPLIHPELCQVSPPDSGDNYDLPGAWVGGAMVLRDGMQTMSLTGELAATPIPGVDPTRIEYLHLLPNLLISAHPDYVMTHRILPLAPDRTWIECSWLVLPPADGSAPTASRAAEFWDLTNRQDWGACESVQRGLSSPHFAPGPFAPNEDAVAKLVTTMSRAYHGRPIA